LNKLVLILIIIVVVLFLLIISVPIKSQIPSLAYTVSGCNEKSNKSALNYASLNIQTPIVEPNNKYLHISHDVSYVCCANLTLRWDMKGNVIEVREINTGHMCYCLCNYNVSASIGPLPSGVYLVNIFGVEYSDYPGVLLLNESVAIK
jgi:hypothetical protein